MIRALFSAASGMNAQQMNVDNIANNLANSNTAGFKARRAQFQELMYQNVSQPGAQAGQQSMVPTGLQLGLGTRAASNEIVFTQGDFSQTSNPLDVVIQGNGFFQVLLPNGTLAYTRAGQFQVNNAGGVVDANGNLLQPSLTLPPNAQSITIATDGTVSFTLPNQTVDANRGADPVGDLHQSGRPQQPGAKSTISRPQASGDPIVGTPGSAEGLGTLLQGYTEQSNVSVVDEFVNLIVSQRAYEANSKVVKAADEMYQEVNNLSR